MTRSELDYALQWAQREGWNPGLQDAEAFYAADLHGFFVAEEDGGKCPEHRESCIIDLRNYMMRLK